MTVETWYKIWCDKCNTVNWICDGNVSDLTQPDIEGFICRQCKVAHSFSDQTMIEMGIGIDPEYFEIGKEKPD